MTGFRRLICPCRPGSIGTRRSGSHGRRASQLSNMSARGRPVPVCEFDRLGDGMAMALMGLYDPDLRIVLLRKFRSVEADVEGDGIACWAAVAD